MVVFILCIRFRIFHIFLLKFFILSIKSDHDFPIQLSWIFSVSSKSHADDELIPIDEERNGKLVIYNQFREKLYIDTKIHCADDVQLLNSLCWILHRGVLLFCHFKLFSEPCTSVKERNIQTAADKYNVSKYNISLAKHFIEQEVTNLTPESHSITLNNNCKLSKRDF